MPSITTRARSVAYRANLAGRGLVCQVLQSRLMRWRYGGKPVERLLIVPQDLRTADPSFASEIYHGHFGLAGTIATTGAESPFLVRPPNELWARELHGFGWLRHLRAADDQISREHARALIRDWIELHEVIRGLSWEPEVVARRVISWISHAPLLLEGAGEGFYDAVMRSLARQMRYLRVCHRRAPEGAPRLLCLTALLFTGLCATDRQSFLDDHLAAFQKELARQILPDGGHVSRNPAVLIELLLDLLPLRQCFLARDKPVPEQLSAALERMLPMLRFFRLGDGSIARFNGMGATPVDTLATVLAYDDVQRKPPQHAETSGYCRAVRGELVLIADIGRPPPLALSRTAHAGCLSFELSAGEDPIIVNCGSPVAADDDWLLPSRSTAAHSTLSICDTSSSQLVPIGRDRGPLGVGLVGPAHVTASVTQNDADFEFRASHDGYRSRFGIIHERRVRVTANAERVMGLDRITAPSGLRGLARRRHDVFDIRFHLHPTVRARLSQDGRTALIVSAGRRGWRLVAQSGTLAIEESAYLADIVGPRRSLQVVISGNIDNGREAEVAWTLERVKGPLALEAMPEEEAPVHYDELPLG